MFFIFTFIPYIYYYGTGSYPLPPQGLHLKMRQIASPRPLTGPCFMMACFAYSLQVGVNLQEGPNRGDMHIW